MNSKARRFILQRTEDESGVSGTGLVAEGVEFTSGIVALTWLSPHRSIEINESMRTVEELHGHGGKTEIVWIDDEDAPQAPKPKRKSRKSMKEAIEELEKK